jgi:hypothetical protein
MRALRVLALLVNRTRRGCQLPLRVPQVRLRGRCEGTLLHDPHIVLVVSIADLVAVVKAAKLVLSSFLAC